MKTKYFETRTALVNPAKPLETIVVLKTYKAANKFEAIGKAVSKLMSQYGGYQLKTVAAYHTRQKPLM